MLPERNRSTRRAKRGTLTIDDQPLNEAPEIKKEEIEEIEKVGSGQYGDVYRGKCRGLDVAIKILKNKFGSEQQLASFKREVGIMSRIRFPNVCLLLGACTDPEYFCIIQEYLPGGDLARLCELDLLPKSFFARMRLASQIARGMLWIHSNEVLHRDLKMENLLLDKYGEVKVCDFGLADTTGGMKFIWDDKGRKGSPLYMAPEVLLNKGLNKKVDVYSFGIILWELLSKQRAFQHHLQHNNLDRFTNAICKEVERPPIPPPGTTDKQEWQNEYIVGLLQRCWSEKARDRPDFQEIFDELNILIIDGYIKDDWGRTFWIINFTEKDVVKFDEFYKILETNKEVELEDGSTFCKGLALTPNPQSKQKECLKLLLAHISGVNESAFTDVTCENFGKLVAWFGPGIDDKSHTTFLDRMEDICKQQWFFGSPSVTDFYLKERTIHKQQKYLIRLGTVPGMFTVELEKVKARISYTPGRGYQEESGPNSNKVFTSLVDWAKNKFVEKNYAPAEGSAFWELYHPTEKAPYNATPFFN